MRMRRMKNLEPRMERCAEMRIAEPAALKGNWRSLKPDATALWVEVGCGKGKFTAETAEANPDVLLIAVERCREAMVVAMEKAKNMGLKNVFFIDMDVANIEEIFAGKDLFNVCNVHVDVVDVLEAHGLGLLHGNHHSLTAALHGNQQHIGICLGGFCGEFALATANFHPQRSAVFL